MSIKTKLNAYAEAVAQHIKALYRATDKTNNGKKSLLIYYGYPIAYKSIWTTEGVIGEISKYDYFVCGDTYQQPTHEEYASTTTIVAGVRALKTKVYGYVPIGVNTENRPMADLKVAVDQWVALGVDGIFLDEFGFDYAVTRSRQIEITDYVRSKGIPYCANAWTFEDVVCANKSELPWPTNDWRYVNFTTYNPTNLPLVFDSTDSYLIENFCFDNTHALDKFDAQERCSLIRTRNKALTTPLQIWAEAVFAESPAGSGNINTTKIGGLAVTDLGNYLVANAYIFDVDVLGAGGFSFGANGTPVVIDIPRLPDYVQVTYPLPTAPAVNMTTGICSRTISKNYTLQVKNQSGITVTVTDATGKPVATVPTVVPPAITTAITAATTAKDSFVEQPKIVTYLVGLASSFPTLSTQYDSVIEPRVVSNGDTAILTDSASANFGKMYTLTSGAWVVSTETLPARRTVMTTTGKCFGGVSPTIIGAASASYPITLDIATKVAYKGVGANIDGINIGVRDNGSSKQYPLSQYLGQLSDLETQDKNSLVAAINESGSKQYLVTFAASNGLNYIQPLAGAVIPTTNNGSYTLAVNDTFVEIDTSLSTFGLIYTFNGTAWVVNTNLPMRYWVMAIQGSTVYFGNEPARFRAGPQLIDRKSKVLNAVGPQLHDSSVIVTPTQAYRPGINLRDYLSAQTAFKTETKTVVGAINELFEGKIPRAAFGGTPDKTRLMSDAQLGAIDMFVSVDGVGADWPAQTLTVSWWNVFTFGSAARCSQIAQEAFHTRPGQLWFRHRHDTTWSPWYRVPFTLHETGYLVNDGGLLGYGSGCGGEVVQPTSKSTDVTLNKPTGRIQLAATSMNPGEIVYFNFYNSYITGNSVVSLTPAWETFAPERYRIEPVGIGAGVCKIRVINISSTAIAEAQAIFFNVYGGSKV